MRTNEHKAKTAPDGAITFSIDAMAARTGLSRSFLYEELKAGKLKSFKVGKRRLVRVEDETAYLAAYQRASAE